MHTFDKPREATVQFSDVFGGIPVSRQQPSALTDFDAALTAQVRNTNRFSDAQFPIGIWPELGDYAAVLLEQLRQEQINTAQLPVTRGPEIHPDHQSLTDSLNTTVVGVINCAPRTADHRSQGANGADFYVGVTNAGNEIYAQLRYFRGLRARGLLERLFRIPDDAGIWQPGEQFRSSWVTRARTQPDVLEPIDLSDVPAIDFEGRVAYADTFGNVRLEVADFAQACETLSASQQVGIQIASLGILEAHVVPKLTEIPEGELGIYCNPSEVTAGHGGPGYLELVRRVSHPNGHRQHAYSSIAAIAKAGSQSVHDVNITLCAT